MTHYCLMPLPADPPLVQRAGGFCTLSAADGPFAPSRLAYRILASCRLTEIIASASRGAAAVRLWEPGTRDRERERRKLLYGLLLLLEAARGRGHVSLSSGRPVRVLALALRDGKESEPKCRGSPTHKVVFVGEVSEGDKIEWLHQHTIGNLVPYLHDMTSQ